MCGWVCLCGCCECVFVSLSSVCVCLWVCHLSECVCVCLASYLLFVCVSVIRVCVSYVYVCERVRVYLSFVCACVCLSSVCVFLCVCSLCEWQWLSVWFVLRTGLWFLFGKGLGFSFHKLLQFNRRATSFVADTSTTNPSGIWAKKGQKASNVDTAKNEFLASKQEKLNVSLSIHKN